MLSEQLFMPQGGSHTRDRVKLTVCVCVSSCNCSTVAKLTGSIGNSLGFLFVDLQTKALFSPEKLYTTKAAAIANSNLFADPPLFNQDYQEIDLDLPKE